MKRLNKKQKAKIFYLYSLGLSQEKIGNDLFIERTVVGYWVRKFGIQRNLSESHIGIPNKSKTKFKKGQKAWNKGLKRYWKSHSFEKGHIPWLKDKNIQTNTGRTHFKKGYPSANKGKPALWAKGENNVNWKGGISGINRTIRTSDKYKKWRRDIFIRDQFTCQQCGHKFIKIVAHHIKSFSDYPELRFDINNGQTLCRACHCKVHNPAKKVVYEYTR